MIPIQEKLKQYLLYNFEEAKVCSGGKEVMVRCRFCGDSRDIRKKHMYISLGYDDKPPMYNCFKCNESGLLNSRSLRLLNLSDMSIADDLDKNYKMISNTAGYKFNNVDVYKLKNFIADNALSMKKLGYINNRLGLELTYNDLIENKIVLNLFDLLGYNNINQYSRHLNIVKELNQMFLGFLSIDNSYVNMRNLCINKTYITQRYINYNIFNKTDNLKRYYVLPCDIDTSRPDPVKIHIAEGPFDVLSIYYNLRKTKDHNVYASIGGKSYLNILKLFLVEYGLYNIELHIYIDNDIDDWEIEKVYKIINPIGIDIFIHKNMYKGEKDFGVRISNIQEQITKL